jgi:histidinol-phosphatase
MDFGNQEIDVSEYMEFAAELSVTAGQHTLRYFRQKLEVMRKEDDSPVTIADQETEGLIVDTIRTRYPSHGIIGEEHGSVESDSPFKWVIDPIDGTKSFIRGIPLYTVLIALLYEDRPCVGVIHNPPLGETVYAGVGAGCFLNGAPSRVSTTDKLADAWVQTTDPSDLCRRHPEFGPRVLAQAGFCRTWADGYGYLLVATGRADVMIDPIVAVWDVAPMKVIITEAGGAFTDFAGDTSGLGESVIASNGLIHREISALLE